MEEGYDGNRVIACLQCTQHCYRTHGEGVPSYRAPSYYKFVVESPENLSLHSLMEIPVELFKKPCFNDDLQGSPTKPFTIEANLEGPSGQIWPVTIEGGETTNFTRGWKEFAMDHALKEGDLLVFKLISKHLFTVQIFGKQGCEKIDALTVRNSGVLLMPNREEPRKRKGTGMSNDCLEFEIEGKRSKVGVIDSNCQTLEMQPVIIDIDDDDDDEILILNNEQCRLAEQSVFKCHSERKHSCHPFTEVQPMQDHFADAQADSVSQQENLSKCCMENLQGNTSLQQRKVPHLNTCYHVNTARENFHVPVMADGEIFCPQKESTLDTINSLGNQLRQYVTEVFVSQRPPVSDAEREKAFGAAKSFKTNRPAIRKIMKESHVYRGFWLGFPIEFSSKYLPRLVQPATLIDASGKAWTAKWLGARTYAGISGGWRKFSLDHGLEEGDVCVFELMDRKKIIIKVHIFRVLEPKNERPGRNSYLRIPQSKRFERSASVVTKISRKYALAQRSSSKSLQKMRGAISCKESTGVGWAKQFAGGNVPVSEETGCKHLTEVNLSVKKEKEGINLFRGSLTRSICKQDRKHRLSEVKDDCSNKGSSHACLCDCLQVEQKETRLTVNHASSGHPAEIGFSKLSPPVEETLKMFDHGPDPDKGQQTKCLPENLKINLDAVQSPHQSAAETTFTSHCIKLDAIGPKSEIASQEDGSNFSIVRMPTVEESCRGRLRSNYGKSSKNDSDFFQNVQPETRSPPSSKPITSTCKLQDTLSYASLRTLNASAHCVSTTKPATCSRFQQMASSLEESKNLQGDSVDIPVGIPVNKANSPVKGGGKYYDVQRLISRRKGHKEDEFLVELTEQLLPLDRPSKAEEENGAWWVPLSYFTKNKLSCHL